MSAAKHRTLAAKAVYLRMAARENGLGINRKWMPHMTKVLKRLADDGHIRFQAIGTPRSTTTTAFITESGRTVLADIEQRYGSDFGDRNSIDRIETPRPRKEVRRARAAEPVAQHVRAAVIAKRRHSLRIILDGMTSRTSSEG